LYEPKARVVGGELVVARCDPPTLLDLVEEPLDQVAGAIEMRPEARNAAYRPTLPKRDAMN